jgi:hypothetical protein
MSDTTADSAFSSIDADVAQLQPKRSRWLLPLVAAAAIGLGVVGLRQLDTPPVAIVPAPAAAPVAAKPAPAPEPEKAIEPSTAAPAPSEPAAAPVATAPVAAAPAAEAAPDTKPGETQPSPSPSTEPVAPPSGELRRIAVTSDPPGARLFWRGKEDGTTPFTLELQADEKHAYELGLPGYVTRKVVIDGRQSEINIGLRPQAGPFTGANSRK